VGKYRVNIEGLESIGSKAILEAIKSTDVVAIDEIGPMELFSSAFRDTVRQALASNKLVLVVVHWKDQNQLALEVKERKDAEIYIVSEENREQLPNVVTSKALQFLERRL
jgi:nucleoside-triphosphatase